MVASLHEFPFHRYRVKGVAIKQQQPTQADMLLDYLEAMSIDFVFGVPGGAIEPLYNALARRAAAGRKPKVIIARHEAGAAFMADGYARETGKLGVCCATTGPGTTNLLTGVASAHADNIPLLIITPQTALPNFGKKSLQESSYDAINTVEMMAQCTRYNSLVSHIDQLEDKIYGALARAFQPPRGPVHLSIPMDIFSVPLKDKQHYYHVSKLSKQARSLDMDALEEMCASLLSAKKIVLFLGTGAGYAINEIIQFAELVQAEIVTTPSAKGLIVHNHPFYRGVFGFAGHESARKSLESPSSELILAIGTGLGELSTSGWDQEALLNDRMIHIEDNFENFTRSPKAHLHVCGNLKTIISTMLERAQMAINAGKRCPILKTKLQIEQQAKHSLGFLPINKQETYLQDSIPLKPQRVMYYLNELLPNNMRYVIDAGNSWAWATHYLNIKQSHHYHIGMGYGAMAWGIGAAVGVALALKNQPVCCITGDGSYLMSAQEITVAQQHKVPLIILILNDSVLGMVKHGQALGGGEAIGFELPKVNYAMMAKAMGIQSFTIKTGQDFNTLDINAICHHLGPTLLDVYIDANEVPPMGVRMKSLAQQTSE